MTPDKNKNLAVEQLFKKSKEVGRLPKKDDFDDVARSRIMPRAPEAAGLKEKRCKGVRK